MNTLYGWGLHLWVLRQHFIFSRQLGVICQADGALVRVAEIDLAKLQDVGGQRQLGDDALGPDRDGKRSVSDLKGGEEINSYSCF